MPPGLNSLKSKVDKLDVDKLVPVPVYLSKLSDVVKNDIVKKTECDELVKKINFIQTTDTSNLVKRRQTVTQKLMKLKKITDHDRSNKYITTQEFNKLTAENVAARLAQANLASKNDIAALLKKLDIDNTLKILNTKSYFN